MAKNKKANKSSGLTVEVEGKKYKVAQKMDWQLYFDTIVKKPCGREFLVCVAGLDENLPAYLPSRPPHVEVRRAILLILDK